MADSTGAAQPPSKRKIVLAIDNSRASLFAVEFAAAHLVNVNDEVVLCSVISYEVRPKRKCKCLTKLPAVAVAPTPCARRYFSTIAKQSRLSLSARIPLRGDSCAARLWRWDSSSGLRCSNGNQPGACHRGRERRGAAPPHRPPRRPHPAVHQLTASVSRHAAHSARSAAPAASSSGSARRSAWS